MSRSNYDKPFYVDVGTSVVAIRCASNHDVVEQYDYAWSPGTLKLAEDICDRMNKEAEIGKPLRNCDVGTAYEQTKRYSDFCAAHRHTDLPRCAGCPLENTPPDTGCIFAWGQMLYEAEEGGSK